MVTRELIEHIRTQFTFDWQGIHGAPHWARVYQVELRLAEQTGANITAVRLFGCLHDLR